MKTVKSESPIAKCFDYEDGRTTQTAFLSGYDVGGRILEGVMFKCFIDENGFLEVSIAQSSVSYMERLNVVYWLGAALECAEGMDVFCDNESGSGEELCFVEL